MSSIRDHVFISYAHQDMQWKTRLLTHLAPIIRVERLSVWDDAQIPPGAKWQDEISKALSRARAAILLVSPYFLASRFIAENELPPLLRAAEEDGLRILWISVSASHYEITPIGQYQALNDPSHPLDVHVRSPSRLNAELVTIAKQIVASLKSGDIEGLPDIYQGPLHQLHIKGLPIRSVGRVQNFVGEYLGSATYRVPFGGRQVELQSLERWIRSQEAPHYGILSATAGLGKSAIVVHLLERLAGGDCGPIVVYFPISARFDTSSKITVFEGLAAQLQALHREEFTPGQDADQYVGVFLQLLQREPPGGHKLVVIVDGLDEAVGWEAGPWMFPTIPPPHLKVLVSAREYAGEHTNQWPLRLGWMKPRLADVFSLNALQREDVKEVLRQTSADSGHYLTSPDLVDRLYNLSRGDPLIISLYASELYRVVLASGDVDLALFDGLPAGLQGFFNLWFRDQERIWGARKPLRERNVRMLLALCSTAKGPINGDDVRQLAPDVFESAEDVRSAAIDLKRFLIGDGRRHGFTFGHPRLSQYVAEELLDNTDREDCAIRFLAYGRNVLSAVEGGHMAPEAVPPYIVYWYSTHLHHATTTLQDVRSLITPRWYSISELVERDGSRFLEDMRHCSDLCRSFGERGIATYIRALLFKVSLTTRSRRLPYSLFCECVRTGTIGAALASVIARQQDSAERRFNFHIIALDSSEGAERRRIVSEAYVEATALFWATSRARALAELAESTDRYRTDSTPHRGFSRGESSSTGAACRRVRRCRNSSSSY
jgi:TIR domain